LLSGIPRDRVHWPHVPAGPAAVGAARSAAGTWLRLRGLPDGSLEDAVLVLSELATNALRHTDSRRFLACVGLTADGVIHVEVHDHGTAEDALTARGPVAQDPRPDDESGRGLFLVEQIADRWGVERSALTRGSAVWARLPVRTATA
jgi:anti-sigma regulatory factor (Ser/Thr protein kinase)